MSNKTGSEACNKKHKSKLTAPRISRSKEHRGRGPIGLYMRYSESCKAVHPAGWVDRKTFIAHQQAQVESRNAKAAARSWKLMMERTNVDIEAHFLSLDTVA